MRKILCKRGHFYDADKYPECPHCKKNDESKTVAMMGTDDEEKGADKSWIIDDSAVRSIPRPENTPLADDVVRASGSSGEKTESYFVQKNSSKPAPSFSGTDRITSGVSLADIENSEKTVSLYDQKPLSAAAGDDPKTVSFFTSQGGPQKTSAAGAPYQNTELTEWHKFSEDETAELYHTEHTSEPIVGWIVCVKGKRFGECFTIAAGKNSIGRKENNRIVIAGDNNISREAHAYIIYEPKSRKFYLQPGNSSGLTYLNSQIILNPVELADRSEIGLNESTFLFIQLCNETFSWDSISD